jgi:hypothetical protein
MYTWLLVVLAFLIARWSIEEPYIAMADVPAPPTTLQLPKKYQAVKDETRIRNPLPPT